MQCLKTRIPALAAALIVALSAPAVRLAAAPEEGSERPETARSAPTPPAKLPTLTVEGLPVGEVEGPASPNPYAPPPAEASPTPGPAPEVSRAPGPEPEASPAPQATPSPGERLAPTTNVTSADPRNAPGQEAPSPFEPTAAAVERILTLRVNGLPVPRNVPLQVPVFYRSRTLALDRTGLQRVRAFQTKVKAAKARLHELNEQTAALLKAWKAKVDRANAQNNALLKEWNQIVADYSPTAALMADSPSLPENQGNDPVNRGGLTEGFQPGQDVEITPGASPLPETLPPAQNLEIAPGGPSPERFPPGQDAEVPAGAARLP